MRLGLALGAAILLSTLIVVSPQADSQSYGVLTIQGNETRYIQNIDFKHTGSVLVREDARLIIEHSTFELLQDFDYQYDISVRDRGTLVIRDTTVTSANAFNLYFGDDSVLELDGATICTMGSMRIEGKSAAIEGSTIHSGVMMLGAGTVSASSSSFSSNGSASIGPGSVEMTNCSFTQPISLSGVHQYAFTNVSSPSISVLSGELTLRRWVDVSVTDSLGVPVGDARIDFYPYFGISAPATAYTSADGRALVALPGDVLNNSGGAQHHAFVGNYRARASAGGFAGEANFSVPHYEQGVVSSLTTMLSITIDAMLPPSSYYSQSMQDLVVMDNQKLIVEGGNGSELAYMQAGNIKIRETGTLIVNDGVLSIRQGSARYCVVIEDNGTLVLNNATLSSENGGKIDIFMFDNARLILNCSKARVGVLAMHDQTIVQSIGVANLIDGRLGASCRLVDLKGVVVAGDASVRAGDIIVEQGTFCSNASFTGNASLTDATFKGGLFLSGKSSLSNVVAPSVNYANDASSERKWYIDVKAINGGDRPVQGARVTLQKFDNLTETDLAEGTTDASGLVRFAVLGEVFAYGERIFAGNYRVSAEYEKESKLVRTAPVVTVANQNRLVVLKFAEHVVPPFYLTVAVFNTRPIEASQNATVTLHGKVTYNGGTTPAQNATVKISISGLEGSWYGLTDKSGMFSISLNAPIEKKKFSLNVTAIDPVLMIKGYADPELKMNVVEKKEDSGLPFSQDTFKLILVLALVVIVALVILVRSYTINRMRHAYSKPRSVSEDEALSWIAEQIRARGGR